MIASLTSVDWLIVAAYACFVIWIGLRSRRKQKNADDYLLGGRRLPWWAIGISLIATSFSSLSLLGVTQEGYERGFLWLQYHIGEAVAIGVLCVTFLPFFARQRLTTAYEYLDKRFGAPTRVAASLIFHIVALARAGLFLFVTAVALAVLTGVDVGWSIVLVGLCSMAYSSVGGLGAVVWTDTVQFGLIVVGVGACFLVIGQGLPGGWSELASAIRSQPLIDDSTALAPQSPTLLTGVFAYGVLMLAVAGTNQQIVQRYLACDDLKSSRKAAFVAWASGTFAVALTLALGVGLHAYYDGATQGANELLPRFIDEELPVGLAGLLTAAIFAASMSSIDSAVHSLATASLVDFFGADKVTGAGAEARRLRRARLLVWVHGGLAIIAAFIAARQGENVLQLLVRWLMLLAGPLLGLFLIGMWTRRVSQAAALTGLFAGYAVLIPKYLKWPPMGPLLELGGIWNATVGCLVTMVVALCAAALFWTFAKERRTGSSDRRAS